MFQLIEVTSILVIVVVAVVVVVVVVALRTEQASAIPAVSADRYFADAAWVESARCERVRTHPDARRIVGEGRVSGRRRRPPSAGPKGILQSLWAGSN